MPRTARRNRQDEAQSLRRCYSSAVRRFLPLLLSLIACCGGGPKPRSAPKPAIYRFFPSGPELECPPPSAPDAPCDPNHLDACVTQLRQAGHRDAPPYRSRWHVLQRACVSQGPCACAAYADALMLSANPDRQLEGLRLLDASCSAGVVDACDEGLLVATLCAERQDGPAALCDELRQHDALPAVQSEPAWEARPLPSSLRTCFQGDVADPAEGTRRKLTVCLEPARLLWLTDVWDEQPVLWKWRSGRWHAFEGASEVASIATPGTELRFGDGDAFARVPQARNTDLQRDVAALPTARQACETRARCEQTLADVLRHTGQSNVDPGEEEVPDSSLSDCLRALHETRRELNAVAPARAEDACSLPRPPP